MKIVLRKEIKYRISKIDFLRIRKHLDALMDKDKNGHNGTYLVRSQYYDSLRNQDLYDNLDGLMEKRKIRIRTYSTEAQSVKLEYKCKSGSDGKKYSLPITRQEAIMMENHQYEFLLNHEEDLAKTLYVRIKQGAYAPKTIVEYERTAYLYPVSDLRITFDTNIKATTNPYGLFSKDLAYIPLIEGANGILEIKYNDFIPTIFKEIIQEINSLPEANSKYSNARLYI